jgi:hypothetical protein
VGDPDSLDAVFVAIGGGGLIAGIAAYLKQLKPHIQIIGVEPTGANAMAQSLERGERVVLSKVDAFADGVAVKQVGGGGGESGRAGRAEPRGPCCTACCAPSLLLAACCLLPAPLAPPPTTHHHSTHHTTTGRWAWRRSGCAASWWTA